MHASTAHFTGYGGGHFAIGGRPTRPNFLFAWPSAEMGFMTPETGVRTVYRRRMEQLFRGRGQAAVQQLVDELTEQWTVESEPWEAAAHLFLDDIIEPADTRRVVARSIEIAWGPPDRKNRAGSPGCCRNMRATHGLPLIETKE
ncbi:carboxyl transferase domain-containing protein [Chelatococcus sp.]|uniref:carboxyl transferase domain-containing protein n=1 Tax=Chelatococcus sp. TaxID=1953771 RepID=UPI001BCFC8E5|nr:carboxyl transferase domain-containing protein [Chelatococcus sp.]MBS7743443.1 hypothetical protein [Chelatococcus sp. HY11]MBX3547180.1 hypothetical protein [Chelatococcus sp.]